MKLPNREAGFMTSLWVLLITLRISKSILIELSKSYEDAHGQLVEGKGNLVSQAQKLKQLGVKSKKKLSDKILLEADTEQEIPALEEDINEVLQEDTTVS